MAITMSFILLRVCISLSIPLIFCLQIGHFHSPFPKHSPYPATHVYFILLGIIAAGLRFFLDMDKVHVLGPSSLVNDKPDTFGLVKVKADMNLHSV